MTPEKVNLNIGAQLDAANRLRVSQQTTLIDIKQENDNAPLFFDRVSNGSSSQVYDQSEGGTILSTSADGDYAICQSYMWAPYFSGKSSLIEVTFSGLSPETNIIKRAGYFSSSTGAPYTANLDGIFLEASNDTYSFKIYKDGVEKLNVSQDQWNENTKPYMDKSAFNVLVIDFLYLGGTAVRLGFVCRGVITWCHTYAHAGQVTSTFIKTPQQPIRYEIRQSGAGSGSFTQICTQVSSEGSIDEIGKKETFYVEDGQYNSTSTYYAVMGFRIKESYRNVRVEPTKLNLYAQTSDAFQWFLVLNPTVTGTFTYEDVTDDPMQVAKNLTGGATVPQPDDINGYVIDCGFVDSGAQSILPIQNALRIGSAIDGTMQELVLVINPIQSQLDLYASVTFQEFL